MGLAECYTCVILSHWLWEDVLDLPRYLSSTMFSLTTTKVYNFFVTFGFSAFLCPLGLNVLSLPHLKDRVLHKDWESSLKCFTRGMRELVQRVGHGWPWFDNLCSIWSLSLLGVLGGRSKLWAQPGRTPKQPTKTINQNVLHLFLKI